MRQGVAAIFGPLNGETATHVQSICDAMEIPHIETRWDFHLKEKHRDYSVNLYPHHSSLGQVSQNKILQWLAVISSLYRI